jgi:SAM-dependent methyltransferase
MNDGLSVTIRRLIPSRLKPPLRVVRRMGRTALATLGTPLRAYAYRSPDSWLLRSVPPGLRRRWRLEPPVPGSRRIEVGSGPEPLPGYIHVDSDPDSRYLDFLVSGHSLPIRAGWADDLLSVHMIEHVSPLALKSTLREWFRVLRPGGMLRIHTPNGEALGRALIDSASGTPTPFWAVQDGLFGYYQKPDVCTGPERLRDRGDHRLVFTFPVLRTLLEEVGFSRVEDISGVDPCSHFLEWGPYVSGFCLEVRALKSEADFRRN